MTTIIDVRKLFDGKEKKEKNMGYKKFMTRNEKVVIEGDLSDGHKIIFYESGYGLIPLDGKRDLLLHIIDIVENPFMYDEVAFGHQKAGEINPEDYYNMDWRDYVYMQMLDRLQHRIDFVENRLRACTYDDGIDNKTSDSAEDEFFQTIMEDMNEEKRNKLFGIIKSRLSDKEWEAFYETYGKGRTQESVAKETGVSQQSVGNRIKRGKDKLDPIMKAMKDFYYDNE